MKLMSQAHSREQAVRRARRARLAVACCALGTLGLGACGSSTDAPVPTYLILRAPMTGVPVGGTMQLQLELLDELSRPLPYDSALWYTIPEGRASISPDGLMTGLAAGRVEVVATVRGIRVTDTLYVKPDAPLYHGVFAHSGHVCSGSGFGGEYDITDGQIEFLSESLLAVSESDATPTVRPYTRTAGTPSDHIVIDIEYTVIHPEGSLFGTDSLQVETALWFCDFIGNRASFYFQPR